MKHFSTRFILLIILVVVGPAIQKMVMEIQQKDHISVPVPQAEESSVDEEKEECDCLVICPLLKSFKHFKLQFSFSSQTPFLFFSLPDNIVLPPPKFIL
jgi:hypothetical protein